MNSARIRRLLSLAMNAGTSGNGGRLDDNEKDVLLVNRAIALTDGYNHSARGTPELLTAFAIFAATELLKSLRIMPLINQRVKQSVASLSSLQAPRNKPKPKRQGPSSISLDREHCRNWQAITTSL